MFTFLKVSKLSVTILHEYFSQNALSGQSSKLAASSYNWEQIRQPEVEDEDIVTIRFTKTPEQSLVRSLYLV